MAERPYMRLRWVTGTLPGLNPLIRTRVFNSSRRALTLASSSAAGTTTLYSRLSPSDSVSVTCIGYTFSLLELTPHAHHEPGAGPDLFDLACPRIGAGGGIRTPTTFATGT